LLAFLDSDDTWLPAKLARQVEVFGRHADVGLVGCACNYVDAGGRFLRAFVRAGLDGVVPGALTSMLQANLFGTPSAVMMRRSLFDALGGFNEDRRLLCVEDYELWCRAAHRGPIYYLPEALVNYREHAGNAPRAPMRVKYAAMAESLLRHLALGVEQRREARQVIGQRLLDNAWDSLGEREFRVARQCVVAAAGVAPRLLLRPAFYKMLARSVLRV
jgi:GT2 family glycosyltransferase